MDTSRRMRPDGQQYPGQPAEASLPGGVGDAASADNNLSFVLRQASIRCIERFRQNRPKPFDKLLLIFAHYFAEAHDLPFVKILRDQSAVAPKPRPYEHPHEFIVRALLRDEEQNQQLDSSSSSSWTETDIQTCLEEANVVAEAVELDHENLKSQHQKERERRRIQKRGLGNPQQQQQPPWEDENDDDEGDDNMDEEDASHERALLLTSYFRICHDVLSSGLAVSAALKSLHPEVADEAASLVSRAGPQLPRAIATMEALARSDVAGADGSFYSAVAKIGKLLLARQRAEEYTEQFRNEIDDAEDEPVAASGLQADGGGAATDPNALQTYEQVEKLMQRAGEKLDMDEHAFNDEVQLQVQQQQTKTGPPAAAAAAVSASASKAASSSGGSGKNRLIKPERFAKVITGYGWSNYNKAHYSFERPPPKTVQAYEFTLFYPDMHDPKNRKPKFEVLPTEKGWADEYCYIEFDAGPPYQKVAYRIVNRVWDPKKITATFDPSGRFKLYFKLRQKVYKR